jgi:cytochrome b561
MAASLSRQRGYDRMAIALHWAVALALVAQVLLGWYVHDIPRGTPARGVWINIHKSTGLILGLLVVFRLAWRIVRGSPPAAPGLPSWQDRAAGASHALLYACMLGLPLTGYLASNFSKHGIKFFNLVPLRPWGADDAVLYRALNGTHAVLSYLLVGLVALHVGAALLHLARRDGVFARMLPAP